MAHSQPTPKLLGPPKANVRISRELSRSAAWPSLTKTKGLRALMLLVQSDPSPPTRGDIYEVPLEKVRDMLHCRDDEHLEAELLGMRRLGIDWSRLDPNARGYSIPVPDLVWDSKTGMLRFAFSPMFAATFLEDGKGYQPIEWEVLVGFKSPYAAKLYEWLALYRPGENSPTPPALSIVELRELMGIPEKQYIGTQAGCFLRKIRLAVDAVNEAQDGFTVTYEITGRGRSGRHQFTLQTAPKQGRIKGTDRASRKMQTNDLAPLRRAVEEASKRAPTELRGDVLAYLSSDSPSAVKVAAAKLREAGVTVDLPLA